MAKEIKSIRSYINTLLFSILLSGCVTSFGEEHYYQLKDSQSGKVTNYFRLKVNGYAALSSARYVSGYYDERAVDMFFNELKIQPTSSSTSINKVLVDNQINPGSTSKITPLSPSNANGALVMILSTNASSVTNTIGQFAEGQVVAEAVSNLANRDLLAADNRRNQTLVISANATASEIEQLMALLPDSENAEQSKTEDALLRVLNAIARGVTPEATTLKDFDEAQQWISLIKKGALK
jgi:hypothetical protein